MPQPRVAVAVSGGRDSTALLHCTLRQARALGIEVWALHVHHGLMPQADTWLKQVRQQSQRWGARFDSRRLVGKPARGESTEAWARAGRYQALTAMAQEHGCPVVLLAHHRRDQAETWLLQALRGAGTAGLAAMPRTVLRAELHWARPWLNMDSQCIEAYVRRHRLKYVEDPSNADQRFARNRLRHSVWPALLEAFEDAETNLAAAARRAQEALSLAQEAADADLSVLVENGQLLCERWGQLPPARRRNALRAWLAQQCGGPPPQSLLDRVIREWPSAPQGRWPAPGGMLCLHQGRLAVQASTAAPPVPAASAQLLNLSQAGLYPVPDWGGSFQVKPAHSGGISPAHLGALLVRARVGGEAFRSRVGGPSRSLKKHFQAAHMPTWQRQGPLLFSVQGKLVFVPGLGPDAAFQADAGSAQLQLTWLPAVAS